MRLTLNIVPVTFLTDAVPNCTILYSTGISILVRQVPSVFWTQGAECPSRGGRWDPAGAGVDLADGLSKAVAGVAAALTGAHGTGGVSGSAGFSAQTGARLDTLAAGTVRCVVEAGWLGDTLCGGKGEEQGEGGCK